MRSLVNKEVCKKKKHEHFSNKHSDLLMWTTHFAKCPKKKTESISINTIN